MLRVVLTRWPALAVVLAALAVLTGCSAAVVPPARAPGPVVVLLTAGLGWQDISTDDQALPALLANGAVADLVPRSVGAVSCPADGALAVSAGRRADAARDGAGACRSPVVTVDEPGAPGTVVDWPQYRDRAAGQAFDAAPGTLGGALAAAGRRTAAIGALSSVALAGPDGVAPQVWPDLTALPQALATDPAVLVADLPQVPAAPAERPAALRVLDGVLVEVLNALPDDATVLVVSIADAPGGTPQEPAAPSAAALQAAAVVGPPGSGPGPALLRSPGTRQDGLVQSTDLGPTVLDLLGLDVPDRMDGAPWRLADRGAPEADRLERLLDLQEASAALAGLRVVFFVALLVGAAALAVPLGLWLHRAGPAGAARPRTALQAVALAGAAVPVAGVATALVPWWRAPSPGAALVGTGLAGAVLVAALALAGPWRRHPLGPPAVVGAVGVVVLTADAAAGSPLTLITPMGGDPLVAGRFYGFHNPLFAVFGTCVVWLGLGLAVALRRRGADRWVPWTLLALGVAASLVDVLPALGADVGGPPALLPATALLALRAAGVRLTWSRVLGVGVATVVLLGAVFWLDWLRPSAERTHLGRFVQTLLDGGAGDVVRRKLSQNLEILTSSPLTLALPVLAAGLVWLLARPGRVGLTWVVRAYERLPLLPDALLALAVLALLGFAANDSGTSIPPVVAMVTVPLLISVCAATAHPDPTPPPRRPRPAPGAGRGSAARRG